MHRESTFPSAVHFYIMEQKIVKDLFNNINNKLSDKELSLIWEIIMNDNFTNNIDIEGKSCTIDQKKSTQSKNSIRTHRVFF